LNNRSEECIALLNKRDLPAKFTHPYQPNPHNYFNHIHPPFPIESAHLYQPNPPIPSAKSTNLQRIQLIVELHVGRIRS
jgi:hypothetical protein